MKKIYLLLLATVVLSFGFLKTDAQVAGYIPSQSNGTYTSIPEDQGTLVDSAYYGNTANTVDTKGWTIAIPFTFKFRGIDFTSLFANSNGGLTFGATTSTASSLISSTTAFDGAIAPMSRDLWGAFVSQGSVTAGSPTITGVTDFYGIEIGKPLRNTTGVPTTATVAGFDIGAGTITMSTNATAAGTNVGIGWCNGEVRTHTIGSAPNRVFIIEWKDFSDWSTTANTRSILNFQVHLEETTNKISVVYGNNSQNVTTARTNQVGLRGGSNTDYNNRTSATDWAATTAGASNSASVTRTNAINPASGLTFTWEPNLVAVDWCNLQWPASATINLGDSVLVYTQAWEPGVTDAAGAASGLVAWIGVNSANTDPASWPSSAWKLAAFNTDAGNNDEDSTSIGRTLGAGTYYYASRWQLSGGEYRYGGYNSGGGGFWDGTANVSGVLTITPTLANDICSGAIALTVNADLACGTTTTGTTVGATQSGELPTPTCSATGINDDVWFSFVATGATHVIDITGATNTTAINVYSGACGSALTSLGCLTTTSGALSGVVSGLTAGNTYLIRVYSTSSTVGTTTDFTICVGTPPPPPANDECAGAIVIPTTGPFPYLTGATDNTFATSAGDPVASCQANTNRGLWYSFTPSTTGAYTISTCQADAPLSTVSDNVLAVFTSATGCAGPFTSVSCNDDGCDVLGLQGVLTNLPLTAGTTYYILVYGYNTNIGNVQLMVSEPVTCTVPTGVSAGSVTTSDATITWAGTGTFILEYGLAGFTPGTGATAGAGGTVINPAVSPQAISGLAVSTDYDVYVRQDCTGSGAGYSTNSAVVSFTTLAPPPANDVCSGAISLPVNTSCINQTFSTLGATDNDETGDCTNGTEKAVWFSFVATETNATITVDGATGFDAVLGVLSACGSTTTPTGGACVDATGEGGVEVRNLTGLTVGSTYFIQVYEYYGDATAASTFDICVVSVPCSVPTAVTAGSITSTSANVTWVGTGTFVLEYGPAGFTPGTGATAGAGGTVINPATSVQAITGLTQSTAYDVYVRQDCTGAGNGFSANSPVVSFTTLAPPPANDVCSGAISLPVNTSCINQTFSTLGATDNDETGDCTNGTEKAVWFSFVATETNATITVDGATGFDAVLGVLSACGSTTTPTGGACIDATGEGGVEVRNLTGLTVGSTYFIQVYEYYGDATAASTFDICVVSVPCSVPTAVTAGSITSTSASVTWVGTGTFVLEYGPAGFTPGTGATAGAGGTVINPATSPQAITGLATSTDYDVYVRQDCSGTGAGFSANSAVESFTTLAPPPANDECVGATTIGLVAISSNNNSATQSLAPISCEGFTSPSAPDVWFQFTPTSNGDATVTLTNAVSLDAIVEVFSGACGSLTSLGCADGSIGSDETVNLTGLTAGQPYYVRVYGWNGDMGTFDIAVSGAAMPVAIEYFRGTKQNSRNVLDWKVSCTGSPSVTLVLERSADGRRFEPIYTSSETAARCLQPFTQNDMQPLAGLNYYRLKTIDIDGKIGYSTIVVLMGKNKGFEIVSLAPNPVKQAAILTVTSAEKSIMEIVVRDINGKQISKQRISLIAGSNQVPLSMEKVAAGVYTVSGLTADGEVRTLKFVKQ